MADDKAIEAAAARALLEAVKGEPVTAEEWESMTAEDWQQAFGFVRSAIIAYLAALEAEGFVVVPVNPTKAMLQAGWSASGPHPEEGPDDIYRAMIAARPQVKENGNG